LTAALDSKKEWEPEFDNQIKTEIKVNDVFYYAGNVEISKFQNFILKIFGKNSI